MTTWIDRRWAGQHGIGRYATEVCSRFAIEASDLPVTGSNLPGPGTFEKVPKGLIYSPGYNAMARAERELITVHDLIHLKTAWPGRAKYLAFYNLVAKPVIRRTGAVITVSETSKREIENWIRDPKVEVANAGLGASAAFHPGVELVSPDKPYLLYVGNMREHKNLRTAIEALQHVPDAEMRLLIPADEHAEARSVADAHGVASQLTFLDPLDDDALAIQYRGAAATVMPSTLEGFGLPPLESIMTGTPVIYWSGCSAVAETAEGRGWAVNGSHDVEEWGSAFAEALSSPTRVDAPVGRYDWDVTARTVDDVLKRLA
ncbi:MAG: glycosyltransferase [Microbacterium sp.]|uniref:glycosyltransferase n=1 Tax=Microbacterium sp. TaxID=51671 RepID=UPI003F98D0C9